MINDENLTPVLCSAMRYTCFMSHLLIFGIGLGLETASLGLVTAGLDYNTVNCTTDNRQQRHYVLGSYLRPSARCLLSVNVHFS